MRTVDFLAPSERAIDPDLIKKALEIIAPNEKRKSLCHSELVFKIWHHRDWNRLNTESVGNKKRILGKLKSALHKVKKAITELPPSLRHNLFSFKIKLRDNLDYGDNFSEFCIELETLADGVDHNLGYRRRKFNYKKRDAAFLARELMMEHGRRPTTTVEGPFFRLASILHEAITGESEENLDRQCRAVLKTN